jgi:hypothetical protein
VTQDPRTAGCSFSDAAPDGTIACFPTPRGQLSPHQLTLIHSDGSKQTIQLPTPQFNLYGDAYFSPTASKLTVGGAVDVGFQPGERFSTELITVTNASTASPGISGVRPAMGPQSWLPDGSLVLWRPADAAGGSPGVYVVDAASAHILSITVSGEPIGYLS